MTFALAVPSASGSIESYIQSVNGFRILSQEEEIRLARSLRDEGNIDAARQLVLSHLRVVIAIARGYLGYGLQQADLIQEGNIGLMKAVKRFDPERGVRLVSFAVHWIRAEMHEFNLRSMKAGLNTLSHDEVKAMAATLGVKPAEVVEMETRLGGQDVALEPLNDDGEESYAPIAYL